MFRLRNEGGAGSRFPYRVFASFPILAILLCSCGIVDLREVSVTTEPASSGAVLATAQTPVRVSFGTEVDRKEAEAAFSIASEIGSVDGDTTWDGASFSFLPIGGWKGGVQYRLKLTGSISCIDGREARPNIDLPFTAVRSAGAPWVTFSSPTDGASVGTRAADGAMIVLRFSEAMDPQSVQDALSLEPASELDFVWSEGGKVLTASPQSALSPSMAYRWTLGTDAGAVDGAPLARKISGAFITDGDRVPPTVLSARPAVRSGATWAETGGALEDLESGQAVRIEFSEPMNADTVRTAVRFEPTLSGFTDVISPTTIVFIPDKPPTSGVPYTFIVSADAADVAGLRLGADHREVFVPPVSPLSVGFIRTGGGQTASPPYASETPPSGSGLEVALVAPDNTLTLTIHFSDQFDVTVRAAAVDLVTLTGFFPASTFDPDLRSVSWTSPYEVSLTWEGLTKSFPTAPCLYLLTLEGGSGGIVNDAGHFLAENVQLILEPSL